MPTDRRRRFRPIAHDHGQPIAHISSAPLAGVLLIAATMLAMAYPLKTHAVTIDLPHPWLWEGEVPDLPVNTVALTKAGRIIWNGEPVTEGELIGELRESQLSSIEPILRFEPDANAAYGDAARVLAIIDAVGVSPYRFCFADAFAHRRLGEPEDEPHYSDRFSPGEPCDPRNHAGPQY